MASRRKTIFARVSLPSGEFVKQWDNITFRGFSMELNAGPGECVFEYGVAFDYDSLDLKEGNDVQICVVDEETTDDTGENDGFGVKVVYRGYISLIERMVDGTQEKVTVHLLGYYTLLALDVLKNGAQTTLYSEASAGLTVTAGSLAAADVGLIMRAVIDRYRTETTSPRIFYKGALDIPDTGTTVTYIFEQKTYREAFDRLKDMAPADVHWFVDVDGAVTLKAKPTSPSHKFVFGRHFSKISVEKSLEKVRNVVLIRDASTGYYGYEDAASVALYGRRVQTLNDYGVSDQDAADELAAKFLADNKNPPVKVIAEIIDNTGDSTKGYDIESIVPGQTCSIVGFGSALADVFNDNMLITRVDYRLDSVIIEVELNRNGIVSVQKKQQEDIRDLGTGGIGIPTTYT